MSYPKDCTNFASQALRDGGWSEVLGFYWLNSVWWGGRATASWTWGGAENFYKFAVHSSGRSQLHAGRNVHSLREGDIVQYKHFGDKNMFHTMVVTKVDRRGIFLSYHSKDIRNKPLSEILKTPKLHWYPHKI